MWGEVLFLSHEKSDAASTKFILRLAYLTLEVILDPTNLILNNEYTTSTNINLLLTHNSSVMDPNNNLTPFTVNEDENHKSKMHQPTFIMMALSLAGSC